MMLLNSGVDSWMNLLNVQLYELDFIFYVKLYVLLICKKCY